MSQLEGKTYTNSIGMQFVRIEQGTFTMGIDGTPLPPEITDNIARQKSWKEDERPYLRNGDFDEYPPHKVTISRPFYAGVFEVTNAQYEQFDPEHRKLRGKLGFSKEDDEAVVFVSWHDAVAFCEWLSKKEGQPYRLPTEAEWEYACRAGTSTYYHTGDTLPEVFHKNPNESWYPSVGRGGSAEEEVVPLTVGQTPPNPWGLHDMHGNVEEWCYDWYAPYESKDQIDPVGSEDGLFRVTRGGSHSTPIYYLRSSNRLGTLPDDKSWLIGFRIVIGELPDTKPSPKVEPELWAREVSQLLSVSPLSKGGDKEGGDWSNRPDPTKPYFKLPQPFVRIPEPGKVPAFGRHNHCPSITWCPNGDLLAIWFSTYSERGREMAIMASRLRVGNDEWDEPGAGKPKPEFTAGNTGGWIAGIHAGVAQLKDGRLLAFGRGDTIEGRMPMSVSDDMGESWTYHPGPFPPIGGGQRLVLMRLREGPLFFASFTGERRDQSSMEITDASGAKRPVTGLFGAVSLDEGATWSNIRLISDDGPGCEVETMNGHPFTMGFDSAEPGGYMAAVSVSNRCIPVSVPSGCIPSRGTNSGETKCQSPDGIIHLISSKQHYAFNLAWLTTPPPAEVQ